MRRERVSRGDVVDVSHTPTYCILSISEQTSDMTSTFYSKMAKFVEQGIVGFVTASGFVTLTTPDLFS
jgi:hypothetical protein